MMAVASNRSPVRILAVGALALLAAVGRSQGAGVLKARSVSLADVRTALASARDGDTVLIPPGVASWTETLTVTKRVSLIGATTVAGDHAHQPMTAKDLTVIEDNVPTIGSNHGARIIEATISPAQATGPLFRISGITFRFGRDSAKSRGVSAAIVLTDSPTQNEAALGIRIDHCHFDRLREHSIFVTGWMYPLIDHCIHDGSIGRGSGPNFVHVNFPTWGGSERKIGNASWHDPSFWGSEKFLFMEDNTVTNPRKNVTSASVDAEDGARYVARYNVWHNTQPHQHGTETGGYRGGRAFEIYHNQFIYTAATLSGDLRRSGTGLVYANTFTAEQHKRHIMNLTVFRENGSGWLVGCANGANHWDINDVSDQSRNGYGGAAGGLYAFGVHSGPPDSKMLVVSGSPWEGKDWRGYSVTNVDQVNRKGFKVSYLVVSNTANTMTFPAESASKPMKFNPGDRFEVRRVLVALDQPGRGSGDLCTGSTAGEFHNTQGPDGWPHQTLEPWYCWNNSLNGSMNDPAATVHSGYPNIIENRDYYNFNSAWSPGQALTAGIASGTRADRPTECTPGTDIATGRPGPGVGYWATDEQKFYVCTAPNTWSLYYAPYVYPHPLVKISRDDRDGTRRQNPATRVTDGR
jgi:hypothetical protein